MLIPAALLGITLAAPTAASDVCERKIPAQVHTEISRSFPGYRLARSSDYDPGDLEHERQFHDGSTCISVASADVDGNGLRDFAFLITSAERGTKLVVARNLKSGWQLKSLWDLKGEAPGRYYVNVIGAGKYDNLYDPTEDGEVSSIRSKFPGIISGAIESSGVAYFFTSHGWAHLWLSD